MGEYSTDDRRGRIRRIAATVVTTIAVSLAVTGVIAPAPSGQEPTTIVVAGGGGGGNTGN